MNDKDKELLAQFHHTVSEQLNARLEESPRFFGLLIVVSTGYGYVLSDSKLNRLVPVATLLCLASTLWAVWYLAALGYAFRFLQCSQHLIEHELGWSPKFVPKAEAEKAISEPPWPPRNFFDIFWLLPGIYHAHAAGLLALYTLVCIAFTCHSWDSYSHTHLCCFAGSTIFLGFVIVCFANGSYLRKFRKKWKAL